MLLDSKNKISTQKGKDEFHVFEFWIFSTLIEDGGYLSSCDSTLQWSWESPFTFLSSVFLFKVRGYNCMPSSFPSRANSCDRWYVKQCSWKKWKMCGGWDGVGGNTSSNSRLAEHLTVTWCNIAPYWPSVHSPGGVTPCSFTPASVLRAQNTFSCKLPLQAQGQKVCWGRSFISLEVPMSSERGNWNWRRSSRTGHLSPVSSPAGAWIFRWTVYAQAETFWAQ